MQSIMLVEDEQRLNRLVAKYLRKEGYEVTQFFDGSKAWAQWQQDNSYDLVVLDIMLPGVDGWSLCRRIRKESHVPIILLTARGEEDDRVMGFELGADDYIVKPFSPRELVLRIKAILKRANPMDSGNLDFDRLIIDSEAREVFVDNNIVELTPKEFDLLLFLAQHQHQALHRETILERVWGYDYYGGTRTVDTHVKNLREKVFKQHNLADYIHTVWGIGYKFEGKK